MLMSKLVGEHTKDAPADATIKSHILLMRAGFIKPVSNGIYSLAMPAKRIARKIEQIIREEMDKIEGQECSFPVVMPREMWEESGRYQSIGNEMVRFKDRGQKDMLLGMTHEEAAVHFARDAVASYQQLPFMIYQFQTKFRDEARCRGGLIRVREFTMKDAYSFHLTQEDLEVYYDRAYKAYETIFKRIGLKRFVGVRSDTGMMGGAAADEFMSLTEVGEDTLVFCDKCGLKFNMEVANSTKENYRDAVSEPIKEVFTADAHDIAAVAEYLHLLQHKTIKAVSFMVRDTERMVMCFVRGDQEVNEAKLKKLVRGAIVPANLQDAEGSGVFAGNIGPVGFAAKDWIVFADLALKGSNNMCAGANKPQYHLMGVEIERDVKGIAFEDIAKVKEGEKCPKCGAPLRLENGIEIGNIFQLGTKYTQAMNMTVLDKDGKKVAPIMGCYGIGVGRAIASVAEELSDEKGLKWPMQIAPFHVYLCPIRYDNEKVKVVADRLYQELQDAGIEVIFDDRDASPGYKFSDCDLMGIPLRVVVSPRSLEADEAEVQVREDGTKLMIKLENLKGELKARIGIK